MPTDIRIRFGRAIRRIREEQEINSRGRLLAVDFEVVLRLDREVDLMEVEFVVSSACF